MCEFMVMAKRMRYQKLDICNGLWEYLRRTRCQKRQSVWDLKINIESLMCELFDLGLRTKKWSLYWQLELFIKNVLLASTEGSRWRVMDRFVRRLEVGDQICTFNYDCLLERSLRLIGWRGDQGYGLVFDGRFEPSQGGDHLSFRVRGLGNPICYLKLHGSLNWLSPRNIAPLMLQGPSAPLIDVAEKVYLVDRMRFDPKSPTNDNLSGMLEDEDGRDLFSLIVPPSRKKEYAAYRAILNPLWEKAQRIVETCDELVFLGYSLPATDANVRSLFRRFKGSRVNVYTRNIDIQLRKRFDSLFLRKRISFVQTTFEDYVKSMPSPSTPIEALEDKNDWDCPVQGGIFHGLPNLILSSGRIRLELQTTLHLGQMKLLLTLDVGNRLKQRFALYRKNGMGIMSSLVAVDLITYSAPH